VANSETHEILGAQLMSKNSTDIIGEISQAIANRMTVEQMLLAMRPHPTFDEALTEALEDLKNKLGSHAQI
jgi:dihydrolipoamide dehydrogenase